MRLPRETLTPMIDRRRACAGVCREGHVMSSGAKRRVSHGRRLMDALRLSAHASFESRDTVPPVHLGLLKRLVDISVTKKTLKIFV